jgi:hypothetical protein
MRLFLLFAAVGGAALAVAAGGLAGRALTQTLVPPPPPFESCKAVGNGTLRKLDPRYGPINTGVAPAVLAASTCSTAQAKTRSLVAFTTRTASSSGVIDTTA